MSDVKQSSNVFDKIVGLAIGIPIIVVVFVLSLPWLLYHILFKQPIENSRRKKFFKRNEGKILLCVTTSAKFDFLKTNFMEELKAIGINDVVIFNGEIPNNTYDNYEWDRLINRENGFPLLLQIHRNGITPTPLKTYFRSFFKKEIDLAQLIGSVKMKIIHNGFDARK